MKLLSPSTRLLPVGDFARFWSPARFCTTAASATPRRDDLFSRVLQVVDPRSSVVPVLDRWVSEGNSVEKKELQMLSREMKGFRRYKHALEISQWMSDRRYLHMSPRDIAFRLNLIYRVHGIEEAEKYFNLIPKGENAFPVYGALLNCYVEHNSVKKAETFAQKMVEMGIQSSFSYNVMMKLYSHIGQHKKVDTLFQEMKEKGVSPDKFTYNILMNAYASACDVDGINRLLERMERDPIIVIDWNVLAVAAKGYMKAGFNERAIKMLKKSEELVPLRRNRIAFGFLISLYGDLGQKDDLYRIWNQYNSSERVVNSMYMCMISSLLKLDDLEGAEAILENWESHFLTYDFRVPNLLIAAYCKKGLLDKVESYVNKAIERGWKPFANTWDRLASAYLEDKQITKAVETLKKALEVGPSFWKPNSATVDASLEYFEEQRDVEGAENFLSLLRPFVPLTRGTYHRLLRTYILARKPVSGVLDQMKEDGFDADVETKKILEGMTQLPSS